MRKKLEHNWERMDDHTYRCKVIGGWLVSHFLEKIDEKKKCNVIVTQAMCFVADRDHEWLILPSIKELNEMASEAIGQVCKRSDMP
jgi:hypothetical protein